ncbi:MAG: hypothetical protein QHC90_10375 [Shinella sp.]|nr:hypothetical protein [Shinella sp.]
MSNIDAGNGYVYDRASKRSNSRRARRAGRQAFVSNALFATAFLFVAAIVSGVLF